MDIERDINGKLYIYVSRQYITFETFDFMKNVFFLMVCDQQAVDPVSSARSVQDEEIVQHAKQTIMFQTQLQGEMLLLDQLINEQTSGLAN